MNINDTFYGKFQNIDKDLNLMRTKIKGKYMIFTNDPELTIKSIKKFIDDYTVSKKSFNKPYNESSTKKSKYISGGDEHIFIPVRYIIAHGEINKNKLYSTINNFTSVENTEGLRVLILIGGKIMKESFDLKGIRELFIMNRPDNIPTLIQIMGRAIRKGSHIKLDKHKRNVNIRIFTSCLPTKKNNIYEMSIEETKYYNKMNDYYIIQDIEKVLHENAIDSFINNTITNVVNNTNEMGDLPIDEKNKKHIDYKNIESFNYDIFYSTEELNNIKYLIKRFFIEISPIWQYDDLFKAIKNANNYFDISYNADMLDKDFYNIALSFFIYNSDKHYTEPFFINKKLDISDTDQLNKIIYDNLYNNDEKLIFYNNKKSTIIYENNYLVLVPYDIEVDILHKVPEIPYRIYSKNFDNVVNINNFLSSNLHITDYNDKKTRFYNKWKFIDINELELAVCDFGKDFHRKFLEELIEYIFAVWTSDKIKKHPLHEFYFKMLNYYTIHKLILFGNQLKEQTFEKYKKYFSIKDIKIKNIKYDELIKKEEETEKVKSSSGILNLLKSSINQSDVNWISTGIKNQFDTQLDESLKLFEGLVKKSKVNHVDGSKIPVAHMLDKIPNFYMPELNWYNNPEYLEVSGKYKENNSIIGYDERSDKGIHMRFKIRNPIHTIKQHKDSRLIEKGSICLSKSKGALINIAKKIGIKQSSNKFNITKLCRDIRTRLIYLELKERMDGTNLKWFYFVYENNIPL